MASFIHYKIIAVSLLCFLASCDKDDPIPTSEPQKHPVEQTLTGNYWSEKICFTYTVMDSKNQSIRVSEDIVDEYLWQGGYISNQRLDKFTVDPETGKLRAYDYQNNYVGQNYYQNKYRLEYPDLYTVRIRCSDLLDYYVGAAFETDLRVISVKDDQIVLDGPIKPYIRERWQLDKKSESNNYEYLGIRVFWTKIENGAEILEPSSPLD